MNRIALLRRGLQANGEPFLHQLRCNLTGAFDEALDNWTQASIFQSHQRDQPRSNRQSDGQLLHRTESCKGLRLRCDERAIGNEVVRQVHGSARSEPARHRAYIYGEAMLKRSHVVFEIADLVHVPFSGGGAAVISVLAGHRPVFISDSCQAWRWRRHGSAGQGRTGAGSRLARL
jgi:hypothetical protein